MDGMRRNGKVQQKVKVAMEMKIKRLVLFIYLYTLKKIYKYTESKNGVPCIAMPTPLSTLHLAHEMGSGGMGVS